MTLFRTLIPLLSLFLVGQLVFAKDDLGPASEAQIPAALLELMTSSDVLLIGERHGIEEVPNLMFELVRTAVEGGESVSLGFEINGDFLPEFSKFMQTNAEDRNIKGFLESSWWDGADGKSSQSMLALLINLGDLQQQQPEKINVYFFDAFTADHVERERLMAENIHREVNKVKASVNMVLAGSVHTGTKGGLFYDPKTKSMGEHLLTKIPSTKSILLTYSAGTSWSSIGGVVGVHPVPTSKMPEKNSDKQRGLLTDDDLNHHFYWNIGEVKASRPAKMIDEES